MQKKPPRPEFSHISVKNKFIAKNNTDAMDGLKLPSLNFSRRQNEF
jgi:hypothetical protein